MGILMEQDELWFPFECNGKTYYLPKSCPHRGGRLDLGHHNPDKGLVVCPLHKSTFCIPDGTRLSGPASADLQVATVCPEHVSQETPSVPSGSDSIRGTRP